MISLDNLKTVLNAIKCLLTDYPKKKDIPTKLPNPNPLTFTGTVTGSYDGSEALTVEIPSVTKPLTYDYMPEGYPKKTMGTVTLMEEQEVAFSDMGGGVYGAVLTDGPGLVAGQTYTVNWDGTEYSCVASSVADSLAIGNLSFAGIGEDSGEPFLYGADNKMIGTPDTSASHIISVKTTEEVVTPMAEQFLPATVAEIKETANNAQMTANNAENIASEALPLSGGQIQIRGGSQVATLTLDEFTGSSGVQKRGIQIGGSGAYGHDILEVTNNDITIYDSVAQKRVGGLNIEELFLKSKNSAKIFKITVDDSGTISATEVT